MIVNGKNKKIIHFGGIKWSPWLPEIFSLWRQTVYIGVHDCTPWLPGCTK